MPERIYRWRIKSPGKERPGAFLLFHSFHPRAATFFLVILSSTEAPLGPGPSLEMKKP